MEFDALIAAAAAAGVATSDNMGDTGPWRGRDTHRVDAEAEAEADVDVDDRGVVEYANGDIGTSSQPAPAPAPAPA